MKDEFDVRDETEKHRDRLLLTSGGLAIIGTLLLLPLPVAMVALTGVSIVLWSDVTRACEWFVRSPKYVTGLAIKILHDVLFYKLRVLKYKAFRFLDKEPAFKYALGFLVVLVEAIIITLIVRGL